MQSSIKNSNILITGGSGFFGHGFVKEALAQGADRVCIYSRDEFKQAQMRDKFGDDPRLRFFIGDVRDRLRLRRAMEGVDYVVGAAALKRVETCEYNILEAIKTNIDGTVNLVEACLDAGVKKAIYLSTDKASNPQTSYGFTKALAEKIILGGNAYAGSDGTRFCTTRYGNVWKSTGSVVPKWLAMKAQGATTVPVTDPDATRFFMTLQEAVDLVIRTFGVMAGGEIVTPTLPAYRVGDLAEAMGLKMDITGLTNGEKQHEEMIPGESSEFARRMSVDEIKLWLSVT